MKSQTLTTKNQLADLALACTESSQFAPLVEDLLSLDGKSAKQFNLLAQKAWQLGLLKEATKLLKCSFDLQPKQPVALQALGVLLIELKQPKAAKSCLELAISLDANLLPARLSLGELYIRQRQFQAAVDCLMERLNRDPNSAETLANLAIALRPLGRLHEAIRRAEQAIAILPENPAIHYILALLLLNDQRWEEGWHHHEWRLPLWSNQGMRLCIPVPKSKAWQGTDPCQTKLLVVSEQGLGDTFQFIRYGVYLNNRVAHLRVCVPDSLVPLLNYSIPELTIVAESACALTEQEDWLPLLSAPHVFGINPENCPISQPYLQAPEERELTWSMRIRRPGRLLVAVHWQGNPKSEIATRVGRSFPLQSLAPLSALPMLDFVSLQKGAGSEQLENCSFRDRFVECQTEISNILDFIETAAILKCCDLVITSDSGLAHLAGALSVPTWLLLHDSPDWRWGKEADSTHWYPSFRLFRLSLGEAWSKLIDRVVEAMASQTLQLISQLAEQALTCNTASQFAPLSKELLAVKWPTDEGQTAIQLSKLGQKAWSLGLLNEAVLLFRRSIELQPKQPMTLQALGVLLTEMGQTSKAKSCVEYAITLDANLASAWHLLGKIYISKCNFLYAVDCLEHSLTLDQNSIEALTNLAIALRPLGRLKEAITRAEQALALFPDNSALHYNLGLLLLNNQRWVEGWQHYEWRQRLWADQGMRLCIPVPKPKPWSGTDPGQTKLVVVAEQGLGDTFQFVRYGPHLQQNLAGLRLCVPDSLVSLISFSYPNLSVVAASTFALTEEEDWIPLLSAPHHFGINPEDCPSAHPYLQAPDERQQAWSRRLKRPGKLLVGVHWQGNPKAETGLREGGSFPLQALAPLAIFPELNFVSLQKGSGAEQLENCSFRDRFVECQAEISSTFDFIDTAAITKCCDLVITNDSGLAHLAGALSAPTWLLLHLPADWRWGEEEETTHWYPSIRLFRQEKDQSWHMLIQQVIHQLHESFPSLSNQYRLEFNGAPSAESRILASFTCSQPLLRSQSMPENVRGFVINLDRDKVRWNNMASQLSKLGWTSSHKRFKALTATQQEANAVGLSTAGELGLWRTTTSLLNQWLKAKPHDDEILHVVEDDSILHPSIPTLLELFKLCEHKVDIVFTEYGGFSTEEYYRLRNLLKDQRWHGHDIALLNHHQYIWGCSSYLLNVNGAKQILKSMLHLEENKKLIPVDNAYRQFMQNGKLQGAISLPFFSTVASSAKAPSTIQTGHNPRVIHNKNIDIELRRMSYYQAWEPNRISEVGKEIVDLFAKQLPESDLEDAIINSISGSHSMRTGPQHFGQQNAGAN